MDTLTHSHTVHMCTLTHMHIHIHNHTCTYISMHTHMHRLAPQCEAPALSRFVFGSDPGCHEAEKTAAGPRALAPARGTGPRVFAKTAL